MVRHMDFFGFNLSISDLHEKIDLSSRSSYLRVSRVPSPKNQMGGEKRWTPSARNDMKPFWIASRCHCISKAQGLNAQAKGEVLLSRRNGAAEIFLLVTTQGKQELGGIRVHLVVRTSGADLGLEQSGYSPSGAWPAFDPLFFWEAGGEAQFRDQDNRVVLIASNICQTIYIQISVGLYL